MRKHNDYFYKCYDKEYGSNLEKMQMECFNEYGYNFAANSKKTPQIDESISKTNYQNCLKKHQSKKY